MKAGRDLDALVAQRVMRWKRMTVYEYDQFNPRSKHRDKELTGYWHPVGDSLLMDSQQLSRAEDCDDYYSPEEAWSPSTDIADAWEVVEKGLVESVVKLRDGRWFARGAREDGDIDDPELVCGFDMTGTLGGYYEIPIYEKSTSGAIADTAPHAIALAALKAVGVEVENSNISG